MTVNAEDIEVIPINDPGTWAAFKYFELYGWTADFQSSETQTYTTSGSSTVSGTFTFSGQFTGSFDASVSLTITGEIGDSGLGVASIIGTETGHIGGGSTSVEMNISPNASGAVGQQNATYACVYNAQSTAANAVMTCNPSTGSASSTLTLPNETITFDSLDIFTNNQSTYLVKMMQSGTEVGSINGALYGSLGGSGTVQLSGSNSETTTTNNVSSYKFTMPYMVQEDGRWDHITYDPKYSFQLKEDDGDDHYIIAFLCSENMGTNYFALYRNNNQIVPSSYYSMRRREIFGSTNNLQLTVYDYKNWGNNIVYLNVKSVNGLLVRNEIYPLYVGRLSQMSDGIYRFIYGSDRTNELIDAQTQEMEREHDEKMDTTPINGLADDGNALIDDADEKFGNLFFPLNHAIETANDLANVDATGIIRLPAIFSDNEYWYLDLTQIEQKLPNAWHFIQALCQLTVAIYLIHGLYNLFFGGSNDS